MKIIAYVVPIVFTAVVIALSGASKQRVLIVAGAYASVAVVTGLVVAIDEKIQKKKLKVDKDDRT